MSSRRTQSIVPAATATATLAPVDAFEAAFARVSPKAASLHSEDLLVFNLDVPYALGVAFAAAPRVLAMRPTLAKLLDFDVAHADDLETHAMALAYSHGRYLAAAEPVADAGALYTEALTLRSTLLRDVEPLAARRYVDGGVLDAARNGTGYRQVASALLALHSALCEASGRIAGKTAIEPAEIDRAGALAQQLFAAIAEREQSTTAVGPADERRRVFTLFVRGYDQIRRAVQYLRYNHGDADEIAPALYPRRAPAPRDEQPAPPPTPVPAPTPVDPPTPDA